MRFVKPSEKYLIIWAKVNQPNSFNLTLHWVNSSHGPLSEIFSEAPYLLPLPLLCQPSLPLLLLPAPDGEFVLVAGLQGLLQLLRPLHDDLGVGLDRGLLLGRVGLVVGVFDQLGENYRMIWQYR